MVQNIQNVGDYYAGDALELVVTVEDQDGNILSITSANGIEWLLKETATDADSNALLSKSMGGGGITITDGSNGEFVVKINTGETANLTGQKHHRCRLSDSEGDRSTIFTGSFTILE